MPIPIHARNPWNDTGLDLDADTLYRFEADGEWVDWTTRCGPEGYTSGWPTHRLTRRWRRARDRDWFELIGCIDRDPATYFPIGRHAERRPPRSGRLFCFANDLPRMYWNNRGRAELTVTALAAAGGVPGLARQANPSTG